MKGLAAYSSVQDLDADTMVNQHAPLVKRIAYHMVNRLPPSFRLGNGVSQLRLRTLVELRLKEVKLALN